MREGWHEDEGERHLGAGDDETAEIGGDAASPRHEGEHQQDADQSEDAADRAPGGRRCAVLAVGGRARQAEGEREGATQNEEDEPWVVAAEGRISADASDDVGLARDVGKLAIRRVGPHGLDREGSALPNRVTRAEANA